MIENLAGAVSEAYGLEIVETVELTGGYDPFARTFKVVSNDERAYFLKQRIGIDPGIALSFALHETGIEAVLAPLRTIAGESAFHLRDRVILLYPFKEGHNGFQRPFELQHWLEVGKALRRIHDSRLDEDTLASVSVEKFRVDGVPQFVRVRDQVLSGNIDSPDLFDFYSTHSTWIETVIKRESVLGQICRERDWKLVPSHADLHVGNILVDTGGRVNLVDWDAPRMAPRECDLMFFWDGGILNRHGIAEETSFFEGYGEFTLDQTALTYYRFARVMEDLVSYTREATSIDNERPDLASEAVESLNNLFSPGESIRKILAADVNLSAKSVPE